MRQPYLVTNFAGKWRAHGREGRRAGGRASERPSCARSVRATVEREGASGRERGAQLVRVFRWRSLVAK